MRGRREGGGRLLGRVATTSGREPTERGGAAAREEKILYNALENTQQRKVDFVKPIAMAVTLYPQRGKVASREENILKKRDQKVPLTKSIKYEKGILL